MIDQYADLVGCFVIIGKSGVGKSSFVTQMMQQAGPIVGGFNTRSPAFLAFGEPDSYSNAEEMTQYGSPKSLPSEWSVYGPWELDTMERDFTTTFDDMMRAIVGMTEDHSVIVMDSFSSLMYLSSNRYATQSKGLTGALPAALSYLSNVAMRTESAIYLVVNPLASEISAADMEGYCSGVIEVQSPVSANIWGRAEGLSRSTKSRIQLTPSRTADPSFGFDSGDLSTMRKVRGI